MTKKILFHVHGGLGANIMKTAAFMQLRKENPDAIIHVKACFPDVFKNLPGVDEYFAGPPQQIIHNAYRTYKDFEIIGEQEPYLDLEYRQKKSHFIEAACRKYGLQMPERMAGDIILTQREKKDAEKIVAEMLKQIPGSKKEKLVAFQWTGGIPTHSAGAAKDIGRITQARNLPKDVAQKIVSGLVKNDYSVVQISLPTEDRLDGCLQLYDTTPTASIPIRYLFAILNECVGFIGIDSFAQHAWAALKKQNGLVCWGGTSPIQLGYETLLNLTPQNAPCDDIHCGRPSSIVGDFLGNGEFWTCPFDEACMNYNPDFVVGKFISMIAENAPIKGE